MSGDLVQRLREFYTADEERFHIEHPICDEAADEIDRLQASIVAIYSRLSCGNRIDSHAISSVIAECQHAVPELVSTPAPEGTL